MRAPRITFRRRWRAEDLLLATGIVIAVVGSVWYHDALVTAIVILTGAGTLATKLILGDRLRLLQLSLPGFFLASYLMLMAMPSLWIAERLTSDIRHTFLLATLSVPIWFMSGVLLASRGVSAPGTVVSRFLRGGAPGPEDRLLVPVFWAFLVAAVPILALVFVQAERVQLLEVFRPCDATIEAARANQENFRFSENLLPSWLQLAYEILRRFMLPFCVLYAAFLWRTGARGWSWIFAVLLPAALAVNLLTLDRAPPFALLVMLGLASLIGRSKGIGFSTVAVALSLFVAAALVGGATSLVQYQGSCALRPTPTPAPAAVPTTAAPTTPAPTVAPTTPAPTAAPTTPAPTVAPTTPAPTAAPTTPAPTVAPTTPAPTVAPTPTPTVAPTPTPPLALGPAVELLARVSPERLAGVSWYVVGYRVFQDAAFMNSVAFQLFDSPDKLLYGRTIRLLSYVGVPYVPGPPVSFVGDLWRNFGWPGVVSGSLALGWILQFSQLRLFSRWNAWRASLFVIVLVGSVWLIFGNAFGTITTGVPALAIALAGIGGLLVPRAHGDDRADRTTS